MTFRGFKSLIFVGGSSNNVYAIDYDFGTLFWRTHHNYAAGRARVCRIANVPRRHDAAADARDESDAAGAAGVFRVRAAAASGQGRRRRARQGRAAARRDRGAHGGARQ